MKNIKGILATLIIGIVFLGSAGYFWLSSINSTKYEGNYIAIIGEEQVPESDPVPVGH